MIYSFSDFLTDNSVIIIVLILGAILGVTYYLKRNVLSKYNHNDEDEDQTPEEILQDELDSLLVTEKYNPNAEAALSYPLALCQSPYNGYYAESCFPLQYYRMMR